MPAPDPIAAPTAPLVPARLRAFVRRRDIALALLALVVGALSGLGVALIGHLAQGAHVLLFAIDPETRLSAAQTLQPLRAALVPLCGGLALGVLNLVLRRFYPRRPVDPIEANALHGGQMSLRDSLVVVAQTLLSNGVGASVGLEAAYTQAGAALASRLGSAFALRRADLRLLVGCGAGGAIAAAFGSPIAGAFYAYEVVIASYAPAMLAPVAVAAIAGTATARLLGSAPYILAAAPGAATGVAAYPSLALLGLAAAAVAVATMQSVTWAERLFAASRLPASLRPMVGGAILGLMALLSPAVLSAGHGLVEAGFAGRQAPLAVLLGLLLLKVLASSLSLGAGFRGGLFFASLLIGMLLGEAWSAASALVPALALDHAQAALAGMAGIAAAIVGAPLTMSFLVLELTGDFSTTVAVLVTVVTAWIAVRETFGFSFATWRFHVRGEPIRSAQDVGWMRDLTVGRLMRRDVVTVAADTPLATVRRRFPLGSAARVVVVAPATGRYAGIVQVPDAHRAEFDADAEVRTIGTLATLSATALTPSMTASDAATLFESAECDALAVVDTPAAGHVLGLLTEAHTLRRYAEEVDKARRDLAGDTE